MWFYDCSMWFFNPVGTGPMAFQQQQERTVSKGCVRERARDGPETDALKAEPTHSGDGIRKR